MRRQKVSFRRKVKRRIRRKEEAYEIEQLMKKKRSEEYEVLEETVNLRQWF